MGNINLCHTEVKMRAISAEKCISEGKLELQRLFEFVENNATEYKAYEMEKGIFEKILKIGLIAMQLYFSEKGTGDVGPEIKLDSEQILKKESELKPRDYFSIFGKLKVPRSSYRLEGYWAVMPLDIQADLPARCYSYLLQELMNFLNIRDSFDEAALSLKKFFGLDIRTSRFEVISEDSHTSYDEFYETKAMPAEESEGQLQVLSFDGKGVPMIKREAAKLKARLGKGEKRQKKKEALVGVSYSVDQKVRTAEEVAGNLIYPEESKRKKQNEAETVEVKAQNVRRLASLKRPKREVVDELVQDASVRDPEHKRPWVVVMDGALGLWSLISKTLCAIKYVGILDIIHVIEYLWLAGNTLYGEKNAKTKKWVYDRLVAILQGRVGTVIGGLKQSIAKRKLTKRKIDSLKTVIRYFENHREWMKYDEYLRLGYPIGTGVVESSCGHTVKNRMEGTGRRWSLEGAEAILLLRSIYTSNDWEAYWQAHMRRERILLNQKKFEAIGYPDDYHNEDWGYEKMTGT
jgi:hypothetical protein